MSTKTEDLEASLYLQDLLEDLNVIIKNKTNDRKVKYSLILVEDETDVYIVGGNLCELCARDVLDDEIESGNLKHRNNA